MLGSRNLKRQKGLFMVVVIPAYRSVQVRHHNNFRANPRVETQDNYLLDMELNRLYKRVWSTAACSIPGLLLSI